MDIKVSKAGVWPPPPLPLITGSWRILKSHFSGLSFFEILGRGESRVSFSEAVSPRGDLLGCPLKCDSKFQLKVPFLYMFFNYFSSKKHMFSR